MPIMTIALTMIQKIWIGLLYFFETALHSRIHQTMREFQDKRRQRRMVYSLPVRLGLTLVIIVLAGSIFRLYEKERSVGLERAVLLEEVERLNARQRELAAEVEKLTTERGVEEELREKFNVVKPGEKVISLVANETPTSSLPLPPTLWWQKILGWLQF